MKTRPIPLALGFVFLTGCAESESSPRTIPDGKTDTATNVQTDSETHSPDTSASGIDTTTNTGSGVDTSPGDTDDPICDEKSFSIAQGPVGLMILQDISKSMSQPPADPKWDQAVAALDSLLTSANAAYQNVSFGFDRFPDGSDKGLVRGCGVAAPPPFDAAPHQGAAISAWLHDINNGPTGNATPLYCALANYTKETYAPRFITGDHAPYLLVVSDGQDNCNVKCNVYAQKGASPNDFTQIVGTLRDEGISTVVIGFGEGVLGNQVAEAQLQAIAAAGGTEFDHFLEAQNQQQLEDALKSIAGAVITCNFRIEDVSEAADPDKVNIYFDDDVVPGDPNCQSGEGWTWTDDEHTEIRLCPEACESLRKGEVKEVTATFGCPTVVV